MRRRHLYLSHPQVSIDPNQDITCWSLNETGAARVSALATAGALSGITTVVSSAESKAVETAKPLAYSIDCPHVIRPEMHENDRSATGFLPATEFEAAADKFFSNPSQSMQGWETANVAQARIVREVGICLRRYSDGAILFIGHGAVGTLLFCHIARLPISRVHDQPAGGGCYFEFSDLKNPRILPWQPMERIFG